MSAISKAIPSHLKPSSAEGKNGEEFKQRHHGKTQSHVVSSFLHFHKHNSPWSGSSSSSQ